jgi:hypothetical protein
MNTVNPLTLFKTAAVSSTSIRPKPQLDNARLARVDLANSIERVVEGHEFPGAGAADVRNIARLTRGSLPSRLRAASVESLFSLQAFD